MTSQFDDKWWLRHKFAYFTEVNMATLEMMRLRKTDSLSDIKRQILIVREMVALCKEQKFQLDVVQDARFVPRLYHVLHSTEDVIGFHVYSEYKGSKWVNHDKRPKGKSK